MKEFFNKYWKYILSMFIGILLGVLINIPSCSGTPESKIEYIEKHDTVTIEKERIVEKTKIKYIDKIDTFYVKESGDTIRLDSIPIEHKIYEDTIKTDSTSAEITIKFHGFDAGIDSVGFIYNYYNKQETIVQKPKRVGLVWCIGPYIGFGAGIDFKSRTFEYGPSAGICGSIGIGGIIK